MTDTSEEGPGADGILTVWRRVNPDSASRDIANQVAAVLLAVGRHDLGDREGTTEILLRAEARDPDAWLELAHCFGKWETVPDAEHAALWMATRLGQPWARLTLAAWIAQAAPALIEVTVRARLLTELLRKANLSGRLLWDLATLGVADAAIDTIGATELERRAARAREKAKAAGRGAHLGVAEVNGRAGVRILASPPPKASGSERALIEHYARLAEPISLVPPPDPAAFAAAALSEFPWALPIIEAIRADLVLARRLGSAHARLPPMLIHGRSGIGKSRLARRLAALAGMPVGIVNAGGSSDNRSLAGTARGWSSAGPAYPLVLIRQHLVGNPAIVIEELDKTASGDVNGRLQDTLLTMLEPGTASCWPDECLQTNADLSRISWMIVVTRPDRIDATLRARLRIFEMPAPRPRDFEVLLQGTLADIAAEHQSDPAELPTLDPVAIDTMRAAFASGRLQARQLSVMVRRALAAAASAELEMTRH